MPYLQNNASLALRKAAHLAGIRGNWQWSPLTDHINPPPHNYVAEIHHGPHTYKVTAGDVTAADAMTWEEVKANAR